MDRSLKGTVRRIDEYSARKTFLVKVREQCIELFLESEFVCDPEVNVNNLNFFFLLPN